MDNLVYYSNKSVFWYNIINSGKQEEYKRCKRLRSVQLIELYLSTDWMEFKKSEIDLN